MRNERNQVKNKIKLVMNIEKWNVKNENKEGKTYLYCKTRRTKEPKKKKAWFKMKYQSNQLKTKKNERKVYLNYKTERTKWSKRKKED